jgi:hypothetical protein
MVVDDSLMDSSPLSARLVGTWELVSREDLTADGDKRSEPSLGSDPIATLFYDGSGHFAAQFMKRDRDGSAVAPAGILAPNNSRAIGGYDAYFGTYTVDELQGTVTQRLIGALSHENVGQVLTRAMVVVGNELIIRIHTATAVGEPVIRTLRWKRVG